MQQNHVVSLRAASAAEVAHGNAVYEPEDGIYMVLQN